MKIEIVIEVDGTNHPSGPDYGAHQLRSIVSWAEKNHYPWSSAVITADGVLAWCWEQHRATPHELKMMRRQIVAEAMNLVQPYMPHSRYKECFGQDYQAIVDEYEADPEAPWVKKIRSSLKASKRREEKKRAAVEAQRADRQATEANRAALIRDLIKHEDVHQAVLESQGAHRISKSRIKDMVEARVMGTSEADPTPVDAAEEALWARICRGAEAQATFRLPTRFHMFGDRRSLTFDF